jgi:hypothetical protein
MVATHANTLSPLSHGVGLPWVKGPTRLAAPLLSATGRSRRGWSYATSLAACDNDIHGRESPGTQWVRNCDVTTPIAPILTNACLSSSSRKSQMDLTLTCVAIFPGLRSGSTREPQLMGTIPHWPPAARSASG